MMEGLLEPFQENSPVEDTRADSIKIGVVGRPNVGKIYTG